MAELLNQTRVSSRYILAKNFSGTGLTEGTRGNGGVFFGGLYDRHHNDDDDDGGDSDDDGDDDDDDDGDGDGENEEDGDDC